MEVLNEITKGKAIELLEPEPLILKNISHNEIYNVYISLGEKFFLVALNGIVYVIDKHKNIVKTIAKYLGVVNGSIYEVEIINNRFIINDTLFHAFKDLRKKEFNERMDKKVLPNIKTDKISIKQSIKGGMRNSYAFKHVSGIIFVPTMSDYSNKIPKLLWTPKLKDKILLDLKNIRLNSAFINMRKFHNCIKKHLLTLYSAMHKVDDKNISIIDLACGKGGDIFKWKSLGIKNVIGIDIDKKSIRQAKIRGKTMKNYKFITQDLSRKVFVSKMGQVDLMTCFFAFHYFLKDKKSLNNVLETVRVNLKENGHFIITCFDGNTIIEKLKNNGGSIIKPDYEITTKNSLTKTKTFGNKIYVSLKESVLSQGEDEFLVFYDKLESILKEYGLVIEDVINFEKFYDGVCKEQNQGMNDDEKEFSFYNIAIICKKN